jgi:hypothetical protein
MSGLLSRSTPSPANLISTSSRLPLPMNQNAHREKRERWSRPQLERSGPIRAAGGLYRTADGGHPGVGGAPLIGAENTVAAAVDMAYRVAEAQIARSTRLAERLREAGDRAVAAPGDQEAVDGTEQLILRAVMAGLAWLEGLADERDPVRRLMAAQYKLAGSMFGLNQPEASESSGAGAPDGERLSGASDPPPPLQHKRTGSLAWIKVVLKGDKRPVRLKRYEVLARPPAKITDLQFFNSADARKTLNAALAVTVDGQVTLEFLQLSGADPGSWKAAVCDEQNVQLGVIEIEL